MFLPPRLHLALLTCPCAAFLLFAAISAAQDPIRVQSDQVLVPTVVFDKQLYSQLNKIQPHHRDSYRHLVSKNEKLWDTVVPKDLTAKDFHLFEDGQEFPIQSLRLQPPAFRVVEDNLGKHPEVVGSGGGQWSYPDRPASEFTYWLAWPQYVLAYAPPRSAPGSCHHIQVKLRRSSLVVWARSEYCNTPHPASDPLNSTSLGKTLETQISTSQNGSIPLDMQVVAFLDLHGNAHVHLALKFPGYTLQHEIRNDTLYTSVGLLAEIYQNGTLVSRFSDFACCDYGEQKSPTTVSATSPSALSDNSLMPDRYETQFYLPPGDYDLRVVLGDGTSFGCQRAPLKIENPDPAQIALSNIALARRVRKLPNAPADIAEQIAANDLPLLSKDVEFSPAADLHFRQNEILYPYFEIYDPLAGSSETSIQAHLVILDANTGKIKTDFEPVDASTYLTAGRKIIPIGRGISLSALDPGSYELRVRAMDAAGTSTSWRSAHFTVDAAPAPPPTKAATPTKDDMTLSVFAFSSDGHPVIDLTSTDFRLFDEDAPQAITSFRAPPQSAVATTPATTVILFDLLNTFPLQREYISSGIVRSLQPLESAQGVYLYLLTNTGELYPVHPDHPAAVDTTPWTRQIDPLLDHGIGVVRSFRPVDYRDNAVRALATFTRVNQIATSLHPIPGPKSIVWITTGIANSIEYLYGGCHDVTLPGVDRSYLAGKCGLECRPSPSQHPCLDYLPFLQHVSAELNNDDARVLVVELTDQGAFRSTTPGTPGDTLQQFADLTGGHVYVDTNTVVESALSDALQGPAARYRLTFRIANPNGKVHKLRIECARKGVRIQAPQSYIATAP